MPSLLGFGLECAVCPDSETTNSWEHRCERMSIAGVKHGQPSGGQMRDAASEALFAGAGHTDHRPSSQPRYGMARGPLGINAEDNSPAVIDSKMRKHDGSDRKSVHFAMTESPPGRKNNSAKRDREEDAAARLSVQEQDVPEQTGAEFTPGTFVQKASGSKLQAKKTRSRPSFVEGF